LPVFKIEYASYPKDASSGLNPTGITESR